MTALWRQIEEMTFEQRMELFQPDTGVRMAIPGQAEDTFPICPHSELYIRARRSFSHSKEWKEFRQKFLTRHPVCGRCGEPATVVHHRVPYNVDHTLVRLGFTWVFRHPECCGALCQECHYREHEPLIAQERKHAKASWLERLFRVLRGQR